jgi:hypothetical protein
VDAPYSAASRFRFTLSMRMARRLFANVSDGPRCTQDTIDINIFSPQR